MWFHALSLTLVLLSLLCCESGEPSKYVLDFPTQDNPLSIKVVQPYSKNYFLTIGDWGAPGSQYTNVQRGVATKMLAFYNKQKAAGMNLLFVAAVGDNFYWTGQDCNEYQAKWKAMYGELTNFPWLAVMGNHDWGNSDQYAMCAWNKPRYTSKNGIPYAANALNADKRGCNPANFYLPDFGYYYSLNELGFELIALDENVVDCPNGIGGNGANGGASAVFKNCGSTSVGCGYLGKIRDASEALMTSRAETSPNKNFFLIEHYPGVGAQLVDKFKKARGSTSAVVMSAYGHAHVQQCDRYTTVNGKRICDAILTGGGGGCCSEGTTRGFYVIGFDDNKNMVQPFSISDPNLTCRYPCSSEVEVLVEERKFFGECCRATNFMFQCSTFNTTQC